MTDRQLRKTTSGWYTVAGYNVVRDGRQWLLQAPGRETETYPTRRLAVLAARILGGVASDAEINEFRFHHQQEV